MKKLNVLLNIPRFYPKSGGGVDVVFNVSKFLKKRGHNVTILTTDYHFDNSFAEKLQDIDIDVITIKSVFNLFSFIYSPEMTKWLDKNLKNFDIIHLNWTRSYQNNLIFKYAVKYKVPYIIQPHGSITAVSSKVFAKTVYDTLWGNRIYKNAAKFIALSSSEKDSILKKINQIEKIVIIPNGIDVEKYNNSIPYGKFREKWNIDKDTKIVLYIGRIHESKGLDKLLEAMEILIKYNPNVILIICGKDDNYLGELKNKIYKLNISKNIVFTGFLPEKEKFEAYIDSDVFVTPKFFGFPITFIESCFFGLPIVTTNAGDRLEWIDQIVGYSTSFNGTDICKCLLKIVENDELQKYFSKNAKNIVKDRLNWDIIIDEIINLYYITLKIESY